jgi:hypothetical protein
MLNSGKKIALRATKKINILTLVKTITPPPLQVKWSVPKQIKIVSPETFVSKPDKVLTSTV